MSLRQKSAGTNKAQYSVGFEQRRAAEQQLQQQSLSPDPSSSRAGIRYGETDQSNRVLRSQSITAFDQYNAQTRPESILSWKEAPRRCLIIKKINDKQCSKDLLKVAKYLQKLNIEPYVEPRVKEEEFPQFPCIDFNDPGKGIDLIVTIGGDGTLLYLTSKFQTGQPLPPIASFARGSLGFLTPFDFSSYKQVLSDITSLETPHAICVRMRIVARIWRHPKNVTKEELEEMKKKKLRLKQKLRAKLKLSNIENETLENTMTPKGQSAGSDGLCDDLLDSFASYAAANPLDDPSDGDDALPNSPSIPFNASSSSVATNASNATVITRPSRVHSNTMQPYQPNVKTSYSEQQQQQQQQQSQRSQRTTAPPGKLAGSKGSSSKRPKSAKNINSSKNFKNANNNSSRGSKTSKLHAQAVQAQGTRGKDLISLSSSYSDLSSARAAAAAVSQSGGTTPDSAQASPGVSPAPGGTASHFSKVASGGSPLPPLRSIREHGSFKTPSIDNVATGVASQTVPIDAKGRPHHHHATSHPVTSTQPNWTPSGLKTPSITKALHRTTSMIHYHNKVRVRSTKAIFKEHVLVDLEKHVLNEVLVHRDGLKGASMISTDLFMDGIKVTTINADGFIISTPSGSTAYSVSAGGSLISPTVPCIGVTPICPHTLSFRPVVVPDSTLIHVQVPLTARYNAVVTFDGKSPVELKKGDVVEIAVSEYPVPTFKSKQFQEEWFLSLLKHFHWNEREQQKPMEDSSDTSSGEDDREDDDDSTNLDDPPSKVTRANTVQYNYDADDD